MCVVIFLLLSNKFFYLQLSNNARGGRDLSITKVNYDINIVVYMMSIVYG